MDEEISETPLGGKGNQSITEVSLRSWNPAPSSSQFLRVSTWSTALVFLFFSQPDVLRKLECRGSGCWRTAVLAQRKASCFNEEAQSTPRGAWIRWQYTSHLTARVQRCMVCCWRAAQLCFPSLCLRKLLCLWPSASEQEGTKGNGMQAAFA